MVLSRPGRKSYYYLTKKNTYLKNFPVQGEGGGLLPHPEVVFGAWGRGTGDRKTASHAFLTREGSADTW